MRKFGLIGFPLSHSFSPQYFKAKFDNESISDAEYKAYEIENAHEIITLFEKGIQGLNVTIPYKEEVIPFLDDLDDSALSILAVNTIKLVGDQLIGYNTDLYGFENSIEKKWWNNPVKGALILGTGGASKAVQKIFNNHNFNCTLVSSSGNGRSYEQIDKKCLDECSIIVNTTPLGMTPNTEKCPLIPYEFLSNKHLVYDLIYNPEKTLFLSLAKAQNANIQNGLTMLKLQAERSWEIWNDIIV